MKRLLVPLLLLSLLIAAAGLFHLRLDSGPAAERLSSTLQAHGTPARVQVGAAALRLLPVPHVALKAVAIDMADGTVTARVPSAQASIQLLALLAGRIDFSDVRLDRAVVTASLPLSGGWQALPGLDPSTTPGAESGRLSATDATLHLLRPGLPAATVTGLSSTLRPSDGQGRRTVLAKFRYRERDVAIEAMLPGNGRAGRTGNAATRLDVRTPGFSLKATIPAPDQAPGDIALSVSEAGQILGWLGQSSPLARAFEKIDLQGKLALRGQDWELRNVRLKLDGQELEGALAWQQGKEQPVLAGTLAGTAFDLGKLLTRLAGAKLDLPDMTDWGFEPAEASAGATVASAMRGHDLDLRLSLDRALVGRTVLEEAAAQIILSPTRIDLSLAQAKLYKGTIKARYAVTRNQAGTEQRLHLGFDKVDLGAFSQQILASRRLAGSGTGQLVLEGNGSTLRSLVRSASGRASLVMRDGEVQGFALAETLRRLERQPLLAMRDWRTGRSSFDQAQFSGPVSHGVLELSEGTVTSPGFQLSLGGRIALAEQNLELKGLLAHPSGKGLQVPFEITGSWQQPVVTPLFDPARFQRTSGETPQAR